MLGPKLEIYHDSQNDFYISETLTSNFVHSMIIVRASNFSDLNFTLTNIHSPKLPLSGTYFHGSGGVRAIEVLLYFVQERSES